MAQESAALLRRLFLIGSMLSLVGSASKELTTDNNIHRQFSPIDQKKINRATARINAVDFDFHALAELQFAVRALAD